MIGFRYVNDKVMYSVLDYTEFFKRAKKDNDVNKYLHDEDAFQFNFPDLEGLVGQLNKMNIGGDVIVLRDIKNDVEAEIMHDYVFVNCLVDRNDQRYLEHMGANVTYNNMVENANNKKYSLIFFGLCVFFALVSFLNKVWGLMAFAVICFCLGFYFIYRFSKIKKGYIVFNNGVFYLRNERYLLQDITQVVENNGDITIKVKNGKEFKLMYDKKNFDCEENFNFIKNILRNRQFYF